jgi:hypothetical protein
MLSALSVGFGLNQHLTPELRGTIDHGNPVSRIRNATGMVQNGVLRCAFLDQDREFVIWRGSALTVTILDENGAVRLRTVIHDSHALSILGPGIELPKGAKRLELVGAAGNLFGWDIPDSGP